MSQASRKDRGLSPMQPHRERLHRQASASICSSTSSDLASSRTGSMAPRSTISSRISASVDRPLRDDTMRSCRLVSATASMGIILASARSFRIIWWLLGLEAKFAIANAAVFRISTSWWSRNSTNMPKQPVSTSTEWFAFVPDRLVSAIVAYLCDSRSPFSNLAMESRLGSAPSSMIFFWLEGWQARFPTPMAAYLWHRKSGLDMAETRDCSVPAATMTGA
mmetsp:Transcript_13046/g.28965  ORF Transcript_13046/g.28965 Transcript_13046/m.28965 type:complete len:221 (-) Transcript_13046:1101-1763(-)